MHTNPIRRKSVVIGATAWLLTNCQSDPAAPEAKHTRLLLPPASATAPMLGLPRADALRFQLRELGLPDEALARSVVQRSHRLPTGGSIVQLEQRVHDLPVFRGRASVTMDSQQRLVSVAHQLATNMPLGDDADEPVGGDDGRNRREG